MEKEVFVNHEEYWDEENYRRYFVKTVKRVFNSQMSQDVKYEYYDTYDEAKKDATNPDDTATRSVYGVRNKECGSTEGQEDLLGYIEFQDEEAA